MIFKSIIIREGFFSRKIDFEKSAAEIQNRIRAFFPWPGGFCELKGKTAYFAAINSAKFKKKVIPGDVLMLETEIIKVKGPMGIGKATATVDGKVAVQAELTFAIS